MIDNVNEANANIGICRISMVSTGSSKIPEGTTVYDLTEIENAAAAHEEGDMWAIVEKTTGEVLHLCSFGEGMGSVLDFAAFGSEQAFSWAKVFPDLCGELAVAVRESGTAYKWAKDFPDHCDAVVDAITTAEFAYPWARAFPAYKDRMREIVSQDTESDPVYALRWAITWNEDQDLMKPLCANTRSASDFNLAFPNNPIPDDQVPPRPVPIPVPVPQEAGTSGEDGAESDQDG